MTQQRRIHTKPVVFRRAVVEGTLAVRPKTAKAIRAGRVTKGDPFAAGELAEVFGGDYLAHDRQQRILGLKVVARKTIETLPAEDRSHFEAYARGVNAYIESHGNRLPLEFRVLRYSPRPWTARWPRPAATS